MGSMRLLTHAAALALLAGQGPLPAQEVADRTISNQRFEVLRGNWRDSSVKDGLASLIRIAMIDPQDPFSWTVLPDALERFGEFSVGNVDASVATARVIADSIARGSAQAITGIRVVSRNGMTRIEIAVSGEVTTLTGSLFQDPDRPRVYVDLRDGKLALPWIRFTDIDRGGVERIRAGIRPNGDIRMVVDLERPAMHAVGSEDGVVWLDLYQSGPPFPEWTASTILDASPTSEPVSVTDPEQTGTTNPLTSGARRLPGLRLPEVLQVEERLSRGRQPSASELSSPSAVRWLVPLAAAAMLLLTFLILGTSPEGPIARTLASAPPEAPREGSPVFTARRLLDSGQSPQEVAGRLGLSIDAIALVERMPAAGRGLAASAGRQSVPARISARVSGSAPPVPEFVHG